jgi:hypothetical protein
MRTLANVGQLSVKVEGKEQAARLDVAGNVVRVTVAVIEVDRGQVDPLEGHCMTDAA